jgi:N-formylglutamate amidohydrolase
LSIKTKQTIRICPFEAKNARYLKSAYTENHYGKAEEPAHKRKLKISAYINMDNGVRKMQRPLFARK